MVDSCGGRTLGIASADAWVAMKRSRQRVVFAGLTLGAALLCCAGCTSPEQARYTKHLSARVMAGPAVSEDVVAAGAMNDRSATRHAQARDDD